LPDDTILDSVEQDERLSDVQNGRSNFRGFASLGWIAERLFEKDRIAHQAGWLHSRSS
jgi:hypothetical protein